MAHLNMTDPSSQCPAGFRVEINNTRFCIRDTNAIGCQPITAESFGLTYSRVCGYFRGYPFRSPDAFERHLPPGSDVSLSGIYVDGVSITYGTSPIRHIWTYAAGLLEVDNGLDNPHNCPCNTHGTIEAIPEFVGNDYYCESSAAIKSLINELIWYTNDPLWDGMQCGGLEGPCCNHAGLPWFNKNTLTPTTATITMRVCMDEDTSNEDMGIERFELYVQ